jgi:uncharacterized membrane protein YdjX (TVP38/TMEM64 family)
MIRSPVAPGLLANFCAARQGCRVDPWIATIFNGKTLGIAATMWLKE